MHGESRYWLSIALDIPIADSFDYFSTEDVPLGQRVMVVFGARKLIGVVVAKPQNPAIEEQKVKPIEQVLNDLDPLPPVWMDLCRFASLYYHRPLGEVVIPSLPGLLRKSVGYFSAKTQASPIERVEKRWLKKNKISGELSHEESFNEPVLTVEQAEALEALSSAKGFHAFLLHGVTGSGKTEVYLRYAQELLHQDKQVLLLVPEINLTPQLESVLKQRLERISGPNSVVTMHSRLSESERLASWLSAFRGTAKIVIGTRLSIMLPMPKLGLIVIDEEHDTSYKQQDGLRYSARDLAVWRAQQLNIPIVLGSATPSLETWHHSRVGRYHRIVLSQRPKASVMPEIVLVNTKKSTLQEGLSVSVLEQIRQRLARKEQVLVFLNRRGFAPVLTCEPCSWVSQCKRCSAYMVLHKKGIQQKLSCHHCGAQQRIPVACPDCGNQDLAPLGKGTQRLEEFLCAYFPEARISRIDADSTRRKGSAEKLFSAVHDGDVDILIGTQMVAKGHDFNRLNCVLVLNADNMLYAQDFRAPERLFAQLMQVSGRAGRAQSGAKVYIQTHFPEHSLYQSLVSHDYEQFADRTLHERKEAGLPPYTFQALITAEARLLKDAIEFLQEARQVSLENRYDAYRDHISIYDPVPLRIVKIANIERAQLLIESTQRKVLQLFLQEWLVSLRALKNHSKVKWNIEVDPVEI